MRLVRAAALILSTGAALPAWSHDIYDSWKMPSGASCCNQQDCRPVRAYRDPDDGLWRARVGAGWTVVPPSAVLRRVAPDGNSHICINGAGIILCFVGGVDKI